MDILELILSRRSYRGPYENAPVPREDLCRIMAAGLAAPSGCNKQTTSLIAVDDPVLLERLKSTIDPPIAETAPAAILVLARDIIAYRDRCYSVQDYSAAIENMLLAIKEYRIVCFLPVGRAAGKPGAGPKKKAFEERAWFNGFGGE